MSERAGEPELHNALYGLSDREFEQFIANLWETRGWDARATQRSGDDGVDVIATRNEYYPQKCLIQTKHGQEGKRLSRSSVQQYSYLHHKDNVDEVLLVTTGKFTSGARESAKTANVKLIDIETLVELIRDTAAEEKLRAFGYELESTNELDNNDDRGWSPGDDVEPGPYGEIKDYATSQDVYARLLKTLECEHVSVQARLGVLFQFFRGQDPLHCLLIPQPTDRTHELMNRALDLAENTTLVNGVRTDEDALFGRYNSTGEIFPGILRETAGGVVGIKQFEELEEDHPKFVEPLEDDQFSVATGAFSETYELDTSILATAECEYSGIDTYESLFRQLPCHIRLYYAFDYTGIGAWEFVEFTFPGSYTAPADDVLSVGETRFKQHVQLANQLDPEFTPEAKEFLIDVYNLAHDQLNQNQHNDLSDRTQIYDSLVKLSRASARVRLSETVEQKDVEVGAIGVPVHLIDKTVNEIIADVKSGNVPRPQSSEFDSTIEKGDVRTVRRIIEKLEAASEEGAHVESVIALAQKKGFTPEQTRHTIDRLRSQGDTYEPKTNYLRTV